MSIVCWWCLLSTYIERRDYLIIINNIWYNIIYLQIVFFSMWNEAEYYFLYTLEEISKSSYLESLRIMKWKCDMKHVFLDSCEVRTSQFSPLLKVIQPRYSIYSVITSVCQKTVYCVIFLRWKGHHSSEFTTNETYTFRFCCIRAVLTEASLPNPAILLPNPST